MKQTAVEWLIEQILDYPLEDSTNVAHLKKHVNKVTVFEQVKAMEKEQIIRAYLMARCYDNENSVTEAEQYYNETFKSE